MRPSGEVRWCAGSASVIRDPFGAPTHVFGYTVDMTERRRTEHELAERQAILQNILDAATLYIGVIEIAPDSLVFLMVNKASADLYRIRPDQVPADLRALGVTDREIANRRAFLLEVCEKGEPQTLEHPFTIRGERAAWCLGVYSPLPRLRDEPPRLSFVIIDITARKLADERQQLLMREVDHRAKNALAVAQAVVELTKESDPAAFKRAVVGRVSAIARTHSLLADGRWTGVDLQRLVSEELAPYATEAPARLQVDGPSHFLAPADAQLIGLIVHELVTNAAKYGALRGADGALAVRWTLDPRVLTFTWTETAPGATPLSRPDRQGFGFRLLDQTIARQLGGAWKTDWTAQGLVFTMTLPLDRDRGDDELEPQMLRPAPVNEVRPPRRVLVAEDEPLIALELESRLEDLGFEVAARCGTLNEAMAAARSPVDLAILDVNLGGETTFELATMLKRRGTRILFCTGYAALPLPGALAGSRVLFKPVNHDALAAAVESLAR
jgi:two-component sensor histidine kinase/CheY-like chemotaxis protein